LAKGRSLDELTPKPYQPDAWKSEVAMESLLELIARAQSTLVRIWAMDLFLQNHRDKAGNIPLSKLIQMMASPDERLQQFAGDAFDSHPDLPTLTVQQWLELLEESGVSQLPRLCDAMRKHVAEERLDSNQLIALTCAKQVPVASLGFELLQSRDAKSPLSAAELSRLSACRCAQQSPAVTAWSLSRIGLRDKDNIAEQSIDFFDSLLKPTRTAALQWLAEPNSPGYNRAKLWAMLIETPFDDVKLQMIDLLHRRRENPSNEDNQWAPVWIAVILGVNRGGRTKPKAIDQLANEIIRRPDKSQDLLPVLAVATRSIRTTEMRYGLAAIAKTVKYNPSLRETVSKIMPELEMSPLEDTSWT
jgi:hypothetical protein